MKIDITFEHEDLVKQVRNMLAVKGLKPVDDAEIRFTRVKTGKGEPERYTIKVACEAGDLLENCPLCDAPVAEKTVGAVTTTPSTDNGVTPGPRLYRVESEEDQGPPPVLDEELGESLVPPGADDVPLPGEGEAVPSMASIRAQSERIAAEKEREQRNRKREQGSPSMPGESTRPPKPGEGL